MQFSTLTVRLRWFFVGLSLAVSCSTAASAAETLLRWKLVPGQKYAVEYSQTTEATQTVNKKPSKTVTEQVTRFLWTVELPPADEANSDMFITQQLQRAVVRTQVGANLVEYDSAKKIAPIGPAKEIAASLAPLLKPEAQLRFTLSPLGKITLDESALPASLAGGDKNLLLLAKRPLVVLPEKAVAKGGTWDLPQEVATSSGQVMHQVTYELMEEPDSEEATAEISLTGKMSLVPVKAPAGSPAAPLELKEAKHMGKILFAQGRLLSAEQTTHLVTEKPYREDKIVVQLDTTLKITFEQLPASP